MPAGGTDDEQDVIADPNVYIPSNDDVEVVRERRSPSVRSRSRHSSLPSPLRIPAPPLVLTTGDNPSFSATLRQDERPLPNPEDIRQLFREELRAMLRTEFTSQAQQPLLQEPPATKHNESSPQIPPSPQFHTKSSPVPAAPQPPSLPKDQWSAGQAPRDLDMLIQRNAISDDNVLRHKIPRAAIELSDSSEEDTQSVRSAQRRPRARTLVLTASRSLSGAGRWVPPKKLPPLTAEVEDIDWWFHQMRIHLDNCQIFDPARRLHCMHTYTDDAFHARIRVRAQAEGVDKNRLLTRC